MAHALKWPQGKKTIDLSLSQQIMHNFSSEISESDEEGELEELLDIDEAWSNASEPSVLSLCLDWSSKAMDDTWADAPWSENCGREK